jgi:hypothetical protein
MVIVWQEIVAAGILPNYFQSKYIKKTKIYQFSFEYPGYNKVQVAIG